MQNSMVMFSFSIFDRKHPLWGNLVQKLKMFSFSWSLLTRVNANMQNSTVTFTFYITNGNTLFGQIWSKNVKIVSLNWNLIYANISQQIYLLRIYAMAVFTLSVFNLQVLSKKFIWAFDAMLLICLHFICSYLKLVAFLVLLS